MTDNRMKEEYKNNLYSIRKELNMTQAEMAEILEITDKTYGKYERCTNLFPPTQAKKIFDKFGYSLEYIYGLAEKEKRTDQFMVDIRDTISCEDNKISVKIKDSYWQYLCEKIRIEKSNNKAQDKKKRISELDSQHISEDNSIVWQTVFKIKKENLQSYFICGNDKIPCYFEDRNEEKLEIPDERLKKAETFINELFNNYNREDE